MFGVVITTRGDGLRRLFHDDGHYERFTNGLRQEVERSGWIVLAYCWMPIHDPLHTYWIAPVGGKDAAGAYPRYVKEGLVNPVDPFKQHLREWVLGSENFLRRMAATSEMEAALNLNTEHKA